MAFDFSTGVQPQADLSGYGITAPGNYRDVFGFENAPDSTNLPQVYEREVTIYGNRTLAGFLRMIGSEVATNSQQVIWAEQRRLHIFYNNITRDAANGNVFTIRPNDGAVTDAALTTHAIRVNDKVILGHGANTYLGYVSAVGKTDGVNNGSITVLSYSASGNDATDDPFANFPNGNAAATDKINIRVIGSEVNKGSNSRADIIQPQYDRLVNNTVIMRDTYAFNGTDANQIGWVEIADENGAQGNYWYLKGKSETMLRWEDYLESSMIEDRKPTAGTNHSAEGQAGKSAPFQGRGGELTAGSEGLFQAIENRGGTATGGFNGTDAGMFRDDLDSIVMRLDQEGNIEENVFFLNRTQSLLFDDGMATQSNNGSNNVAWGLFNNSESMGLSLGFQSVRRGSYDFYKKDWKYLNQVDGRRSFNDVEGVSIPMGTKSVYDQYGTNLSMPFASVHYLSAPHHDRKNKSWVHGGLAPTPTDGLDDLKIEFLTERCLCVKGANNFILFR